MKLPSSIARGAVALCCVASAAAHAQDLSEIPRLVAQLNFESLPVFINPAGPEVFAASLENSMNRRVVKGAPYCAEAVHESVQWLPDGNGGAPNRITRAISTQLCRDGEGRSRIEQAGGRTYTLYDPVAGETWVVDKTDKTARVLGLARSAAGSPPADAAAWREYGDRMREWARQFAERARAPATGGSAPPLPPPAPHMAPAPPAAPVPPTPVVISRSERSDDGQRQVRVNVVRLNGDEARADASLAPPPVLARAMAWAPRGPGAVTPLPAKDIDGVRANGEKTTWVIEAGKVGNDKPIQITREVWTSPELMVTLQSRDFDPRTGEVNYRLKNLKRGEPDAALMKVPADYTRLPRPGSGASGPTG